MRRSFLILSLLPVALLVSSASLAQSKLDASILSYDGKDFVRTETTLMNEGQAAVGTKLEPDSAAYKALVEKKSYTGPVSVFGRNYQGNYAPLVGADGKLTGALFVGVPKSISENVPQGTVPYTVVGLHDAVGDRPAWIVNHKATWEIK
jgi:hypothetical protein